MSAAIVHLNAPAGDRLPTELLERAVLETLAREGTPGGELSITFLPDREIAVLNERYLRHAGPTDVISFALHEAGGTPLGDVYVGIGQARRQAATLGIPLHEELVRLTVHGTLHVLGHDHPADGPARASSEQYRLQEDIVQEVMSEARGRGRVSP